MKALREAVEVGRRAQELSEAEGMPATHAPPAAEADAVPAESNGRSENFAGIGDTSQESFAGRVQVEIGPLGDYSQLVGIEDAIGRLGASEISIQRFSEGRATLSMHLEEPLDLLRELEANSPFEFRVRRAADDSLVLDVEDDDPEHRAA
jgi:hypothetical protein